MLAISLTLAAQQQVSEIVKAELYHPGIIISMLILVLCYRHKKNQDLKRQYLQLQEEKNCNIELRGIRKTVVSSLKQQLDSPVRVLQGYARIFNDPAFRLPIEERSKRYMDIANAAHTIEVILEPVIVAYSHEGTSINNEQRKICQDSLRSSLVTLTAVSEMIVDDTTHQIPQEEYLKMRSEISQCAHHVASSVRELIELCLIDEETKMEMNDEICLNEFALATLNSYDMRNRELSVEFDTNIGHDTKILTNHNALQEILNCLLSNADKYATGGVVKMSCHHAPDGTYCISIINEGTAISPEYAESLFAPFVRIPEGSHTLGLGLTLARKLSDSMGYELICDAGCTEGVCFSVTRITC
ncbi:MAG: HAMP domain-containing histidine kinase [Prevotella sp.]|nr:HAMP domain-containing histidine kinase [Prevotella sp.]